jgi:hypothetical protein
MTREEDRLENEARAIEVCLGFVISAMAAKGGAGTAFYVRELENAGFSSNKMKMREVIQDKLGGTLSPATLIEVSVCCATLLGVATHVRNLSAVVGPDDVELQSALSRLAGAQDFVQLAFAKLRLRRSRIENELLPLYRSRIEAGLSAPHG